MLHCSYDSTFSEKSNMAMGVASKHPTTMPRIYLITFVQKDLKKDIHQPCKALKLLFNKPLEF